MSEPPTGTTKAPRSQSTRRTMTIVESMATVSFGLTTSMVGVAPLEVCAVMHSRFPRVNAMLGA